MVGCDLEEKDQIPLNPPFLKGECVRKGSRLPTPWLVSLPDHFWIPDRIGNNWGVV